MGFFGSEFSSDPLPQNFVIGPIHRPERHEIAIEPVFSFENRRVAAGKELPLNKMADHLLFGVDFISTEIGQIIVLKAAKDL